MSNRYITEGNTTRLIITSRKYGEVECYIDTEDLPLVKQYKWCLSYHSHVKDFYIKSNNPKISLHRLILNPPSGLQVDHIDRNPRNNRKSNLRPVTCRENLMNRRVYNHSTGYRYIRLEYRANGRLKYDINIPGKERHSFCDKPRAFAYYLECILCD